MEKLLSECEGLTVTNTLSKMFEGVSITRTPCHPVQLSKELVTNLLRPATEVQVVATDTPRPVVPLVVVVSGTTRQLDPCILHLYHVVKFCHVRVVNGEVWRYVMGCYPEGKQVGGADFA
jgi:hypothetical protein